MEKNFQRFLSVLRAWSDKSFFGLLDLDPWYNSSSSERKILYGFAEIRTCDIWIQKWILNP